MNDNIANTESVRSEHIQQISGARFIELAILAIFLLLIANSLWAVTAGWSNPVTDFHHFRQTQTAITSYYLLQGGPLLAYETPVLGAPWSIPFEFPVYQYAVSAMAYLLNTPLDQTGRFVSIIFFYLCLVCVYFIFRQYRVSTITSLIILSLMLASPLYLFWSRAFLIESTALFFALLYLYLVVVALKENHKTYFALAAVTGVLAGLAKVTTFIGVGYLSAAVVFHHWYVNDKSQPFKNTYKKYLLPFLSFAFIPLAVAGVWTKYTDIVKAKNPLADFMLSSNLKNWNFGTLEQRLSGELWLDTIGNRILPDLMGYSVWLAAIVVLLVWGLARKLPEAKQAGVLLAAFLMVLLTFTNLHIKHFSYPYANGLFFIAATGLLLGSQFKAGSTGKIIGTVLFAGILVSSLKFYYGNYYQNYQARDLGHTPLVNLANIVKTFTSPDDVLLIYGYDWNSGIAYYSERRAIMDRELRSIQDEAMQQSLNNIEPRSLGAALLCREVKKQPDIAISNLKQLGFQLSPSYSSPMCDVYLPQNKPTVTHFLGKSDWGGQGQWSYRETTNDQGSFPDKVYNFSSDTKKAGNVSVLESAVFPLDNLKVISVPLLFGSVNGIEVMITDSTGQNVLVSLDTDKLEASWFNWQVLAEQLPADGGAKLVIRDIGPLAEEWVTIGPPKFVYVQK